MPWAIVAVLALILGVGVVVLISGGSDGDSTDSADSADVETTDEPTDDPTTSSSTTTSRSTTSTSATTTTTTPSTRLLKPASATQTSQLEDVELCDGTIANYSGARIMDGDLNTGWATDEGDGTGSSVTLNFNPPVHLTKIELTPGFFKRWPRNPDCSVPIDAFPLNRFINSVQYDFSNGAVAVQTFEPVREIQGIDVTSELGDAEISWVRITIGSTTRPAGADDDTVISEVYFTGW